MGKNSDLRFLSNVMKTCGLWICVLGYDKSPLYLGIGLLLLILSWYVLDFHYWSDGRKTMREYLKDGE